MGSRRSMLTLAALMAMAIVAPAPPAAAQPAPDLPVWVKAAPAFTPLEPQPVDENEDRDVDELDAVVVKEGRGRQRPHGPWEITAQIGDAVDERTHLIQVDGECPIDSVGQGQEERPGERVRRDCRRG